MGLQWLARGELRDDERDEKHGRGCEEGSAGYVNHGAGADGFGEDVGE